jgi:hypothetical protein
MTPLTGTGHTIVIDLFSFGVEISPIEKSSPEDHSLGLLLSDSQFDSTARTFREDPVATIRKTLIDLEHLKLLSETSIVFGFKSDPFHPYKQKFDSALQIIELFSIYKPKKVTIQTRSSLILLALPVLKSMGDSLLVTIALESTSDVMNKRYTPLLPRPSERIKAARTLRSLGIHTLLQVAPLVPRGSHSDEVLTLACLINELSDQIRILEIGSLMPEMMAKDESASIEYFKPRIDPLASKILKSQIQKLAPTKLLQEVTLVQDKQEAA